MTEKTPESEAIDRLTRALIYLLFTLGLIVTISAASIRWAIEGLHS